MARPKRPELPKRFGLQTHRRKYKQEKSKPKKVPAFDFIKHQSRMMIDDRILNLERILKVHPEFQKFLKKNKISKISEETLKTGERIWEWIAKNMSASKIVEREGKKEKIPYNFYDRTFDVQQIIMPLIMYKPKATELKTFWEKIKEGALPELPANARREFMVYTLPNIMRTNPEFKDLAQKVDLILMRMLPSLKKKKADPGAFLKFSLTRMMKKELSLEELELVGDLVERCPDLIDKKTVDDYLHFNLPKIAEEEIRRKRAKAHPF